MDEYIKRETFLKDIEERYCLPCKEEGKDHNGCRCYVCWVDDMLGDVIDAPAADVAPVVRCMECKHCDPENDHCDHPMGTAAPLKRKPDDFCSYGERKDSDSYAKAD